MGSSTIEVVRSRRSVPAAITLFFVAPFVAEYLVGDLSLKSLVLLVVVGPICGGGAVLIRELARRKRRGWPTILCLSAAYALLLAGTANQSLFNSGCEKLLQVHFLRPAYAEWLGIAAWWMTAMVGAGTFWSIGISIALAEGLFPDRAYEPWLGWAGEAIFGVLFVLGLIWAGVAGYKTNTFCATPTQIGIATLLFLSLVVVAFVTPAGRVRRREGRVPSPWLTGIVALVLEVVVLVVSTRLGWGVLTGMLAVNAAFLLLVYVLSCRTGWTLLHAFSLGAGGALAYGLHAFWQKTFGASPVLGRVGNVIFLAIAFVLVAVGARRTAALVDVRPKVA
jgi:hypothetical protein